MPLLHRARSFIVVCTIAGFALGGCGITGDDPAPTPTATTTATATAVATRTPTSTHTALPETETWTPEPSATAEPESTATPDAGAAAPPPPTAFVPPPPADGALVMGQGRTTVVRTPKGSENGATVLFRGGEFPMLDDGAGNWWTVIGAGAAAALGESTITINLLDPLGGLQGTRSVVVTVAYTEYPVENIDIPPGQGGLLTPEEVQKELDIRARVFAVFTPAKLWSGPFIAPVAGPISSPYGIGRSFNGGPVSGFHSGTDFGVDEGTPIVAAATGRVAFAGALTTRGMSVMIDHGGGVFTGYHHMSGIDVVEGQDVALGTPIGAVGATGLATGPHLHWELVIRGINVDPMFWTYDGVAP